MLEIVSDMNQLYAVLIYSVCIASYKSVVIFFPFLVAAIIGELFFPLISRPRLIVQIWSLSYFYSVIVPNLDQ